MPFLNPLLSHTADKRLQSILLSAEMVFKSLILYFLLNTCLRDTETERQVLTLIGHG